MSRSLDSGIRVARDHVPLVEPLADRTVQIKEMVWAGHEIFVSNRRVKLLREVRAMATLQVVADMPGYYGLCQVVAKRQGSAAGYGKPCHPTRRRGVTGRAARRRRGSGRRLGQPHPTGRRPFLDDAIRLTGPALAAAAQRAQGRPARTTPSIRSSPCTSCGWVNRAPSHYRATAAGRRSVQTSISCI
jgi:hypothetical protein